MSAIDLARLPASIAGRLIVPLIVAPMLRVSGPDLVTAVCKAGAIGAFPTKNARSIEELDHWLKRMTAAAQSAEHPVAPHCPNIIMRTPDLGEHVATIVRNRVEMVITSVGSPAAVVKPLHDGGCLVFSDVATLRHAEQAVAAGADGLVLLTAGAGGQTGWLNPFAYVRAVRGFFDGPLILAGGISDGRALWAARALGCDLGYMGTKFIATHESMAAPKYKEMVVSSTIDDVMLTRHFTGLRTSYLRPSIIAAGIDPDMIEEGISPQRAGELYGGKAASEGPRRWVDIMSAGHTVSAVHEISAAADVVERTKAEYLAARSATA